MNQTLTIYELPPTLNAMNNVHHMKRAKMKEHWNTVVERACREYGIQPMNKVSVTLEFWFPDKKRRDLDNYSGFGFKFILDGLVSGGVLKDDSVKEIVELRIIPGGIGKPVRTYIHLQEVKG